MSLSHRGGRALAAVGHAGMVGCDLELVEPRSRAFVREWLAPAEQRLLAACAAERDLLTNLVWTAKEAAAKVRREGLRLESAARPCDVRDVSARRGLAGSEVDWSDGGARAAGWWRGEPGWVMAILGAPAPDPPELLAVDSFT